MFVRAFTACVCPRPACSPFSMVHSRSEYRKSRRRPEPLYSGRKCTIEHAWKDAVGEASAARRSTHPGGADEGGEFKGREGKGNRPRYPSKSPSNSGTHERPPDTRSPHIKMATGHPAPTPTLQMEREGGKDETIHEQQNRPTHGSGAGPYHAWMCQRGAPTLLNYPREGKP